MARLEERYFASEKALLIQTSELHRRLDELNGEAETLKGMQSTYVPRENYETQHEELERRIGAVEGFKSNMEGRQVVWGIIILIASACIGLVGRFIK